MHRDEPVRTSEQAQVRGLAPLSEREREVLVLLGRVLTNREIADELYLSVNTIKSHVAKVFAKLAVANRSRRRGSPSRTA